jgi:tRNA dimethylallyltransferase
LEVFELTGKPRSVWQKEHGFAELRHPHALFGLQHTPEELTARIQQRVAGFFDEGWLDEVAQLVTLGYGKARAMQSVGYAEVYAHLEGEIAAADLHTRVVQSTRVFTRRQKTWLREAGVAWF